MISSHNKLYRVLFLLSYTLFIVSYYSIGNLSIFGLPLNLVQISSILLLILCFFDDVKIFVDKYVILYIIFLFFFALSSLYTDYFDNYTQRLVRFTLISYIAYWSSQKLIFKYNSYWPFLIPILIIGSFDSIVTVSQAFGSHYFDWVLDLLGSFDEEESIRMDRRGDLLGISVSGIYHNPVRNGHYLLFMFVISFLLHRSRLSLLNYIPSFLILVGLFFCQQRSAILFSLLILAFYIYKYAMIKKHRLLFAIIALLFILFLPSILEILSSYGTRINSMDSTGRDKVAIAAIDFYLDHPILGGYKAFTEMFGYPSHNLFISAFLAGGIFGGIILIYMVFDQIKNSIKCLNKYNNTTLLVFSCALWGLIGDSMLHNSGYVEGDTTTWICCGFLFAYIKRIKSPTNLF